MITIEPILLEQEILKMYSAYQKVVLLCSKFENPEGQINSSILDVIAKSQTIDAANVDLAAFGNYIKFMLYSQTMVGISFPTQAAFNSWYNKDKDTKSEQV
jgi:hypothetical protein